MNHFLNHWKLHWIKYLVGIILLISVPAYLYLNIGNADSTPVFKSWIGGPVSTPTKVGVQGFQYPQAIVIDSQGNKFFTSTYVSIIKYDANDNLVTTFGEVGTTTGKIRYAERLALDLQGNVYVTDGGNSKVLKFDNNGNFLFEFGSYDAGGADGKFKYPTGVAVNPTNNNIYVSDCNRHDVQVFDANGNYIEKFGTQGSGDGQLYCPYGVTFDHNNDIYIADYSNNRVQKFASTTHTFLSKFGTQGSGDGQFRYLTNIVIDSNGDLWVSDLNNNRVQKFSSTTNAFISKFGTLLNGYGDIAVDLNGNVYVAAQGEYKLLKYDSAGNLLKSYQSVGDADGELNFPIGIVVDSTGNIYVADDRNQRIQKFDSNGNFLLKFGSAGSGDGQFVTNNSINDLAIDAQDNIYVGDLGGYRIQKFDKNGNFLLKFGSQGTGDGQIDGPGGLVVHNATGNIYVAEAFNHRVSVFNSAGNFLFKFGTVGSTDGQFQHVTGITITPQNFVYVFDRVDYNNYRIQKFDINGNFILSHLYPYGDGNNNLYPYYWLTYLDTDSAGNIYVADYYNFRVQKFNGNLDFVSSFSTANKGLNPMGIFRDSSGTFYLTDLYGNSAAIYAPTPLLITSISSSVSTSSAVISWTSSDTASSQVEYGPTTSYGTSTVEGDTSPRVLSHSITLSNLIPCTTYQYRVKSTNADLVTTISTSTSFSTAGCTGMSEVLSTNEVKASSTATSTVSLEVIALTIPPSVSTSTEIVFQAKKLEPVTFFEEAKTPTGKIAVGTSVFNLSAIDIQTNDKVSTFSKPILISTTYSPSDLNGIDPNTLAIYRYDGSAWFPLSNCSTNTDTYTVSCYTSNFSDFALFATPVSTTNTSNTSGGGLILPINAQVGDTNTNTATVAMNPVQQAINSLNTVSIKFSRNLKRGMSGTDVSTLQQYLSTIPGIYPEALITGYFGNLTYKAVKRYQCQYDIVCLGTEEGTGWGVVGKRTREVLK